MQYQFEEFNLKYEECIGSRCWEMSKNIWGDLLTEEGYLIVPRELRVKRKELGLNNEEYAILLDYLDCFKLRETESPYQRMAKINGITVKTIQRRLSALEKKGLLKREVRVYANGKINGVAFSPEPLVRKLESLVESRSLNGGSLDMRSSFEPQAEYKLEAEIKDKKWKDEFCSTRWYNDVFAEMYEESSGQPVLTGGREYKSAEIYFRRLKELNPALSDEGLYIRATEGARFMLDSQLGGGVFGWLHKPPDICMLANQTQAVDYQLRTIERVYGELDQGLSEEINGHKVGLSFTKKDKEARNDSKQIERVFEELRRIEQRDIRGGFQKSLRSRVSGDES